MTSSQLTVQDSQLASTVAGLVRRLILYPIDTLKTRAQHVRYLQNANAGSTHRYLIDFIRREGLRGLYKGMTGSLVATVPYSLVYMPAYEFGKAKLQWMGKKKRILLSGALAGFAASFVRVPIDVVKKRVQAGMDSSVIAAVRSISREHGGIGKLGNISKFYAGWKSGVLYDVRKLQDVLLCISSLQILLAMSLETH